MTLFTKTQIEQLIANCQAQIARMDDDIAYGLFDLGLGTPEIGFVCMREIRELRGPLGLPVERDLHFDADKTLSAYADEARVHGRIVT
jgi:Protein of unknown function (DUF2958)